MVSWHWEKINPSLSRTQQQSPNNLSSAKRRYKRSDQPGSTEEQVKTDFVFNRTKEMFERNHRRVEIVALQPLKDAAFPTLGSRAAGGRGQLRSTSTWSQDGGGGAWKSVGLSPAAAGLRLCQLLQDGVGPVHVPGGRRAEAPELADGLADGAGVVGQALDVLEGQVDDLVAAGAAVEVSAGEALQTRLVGDAALAVGSVRAQRHGARQGAALQAARQDRALLGGRPGQEQGPF